MFPTKSTLYILPLLCILAITTTFSICANESGKSNILNHNIEIELFLKEHKLKAVDHLLLPNLNAEKVTFFINKSFQILSVGASNNKLDFKTTSNGDGQCLEVLIPSDLRQSDSLILDIAYEGILFEKPGAPRRMVLLSTTRILSRILASSRSTYAWYPDMPG